MPLGTFHGLITLFRCFVFRSQRFFAFSVLYYAWYSTYESLFASNQSCAFTTLAALFAARFPCAFDPFRWTRFISACLAVVRLELRVTEIFICRLVVTTLHTRHSSWFESLWNGGKINNYQEVQDLKRLGIKEISPPPQVELHSENSSATQV